MALETASFIANLVVSNPDGGDQRSTADDHIRLLKAVLRRQFPNLDSAVSLSAAQIAFSNDLSASVQLQLNQLRDGSATANNAINSRYATSASNAVIALTANSASYAALAGVATLAITANSASYAVLAGTATLALTANSASYAALAGLAAVATVATTATNATTATTAASANAVGGYTADAAATPSTLAVRNSNGSLFAVYFNQSSAAEAAAVDHIITTQGDGYFRKATVAHAGQYIAGQNITGRTGTGKTLQSGVGPPSLVGSVNGDFFYYY